MSNNQSNRRGLKLESLELRSVPAMLLGGYIGPAVFVGPQVQVATLDTEMQVEATQVLGKPGTMPFRPIPRDQVVFVESTSDVGIPVEGPMPILGKPGIHGVTATQIDKVVFADGIAVAKPQKVRDAVFSTQEWSLDVAMFARPIKLGGKIEAIEIKPVDGVEVGTGISSSSTMDPSGSTVTPSTARPAKVIQVIDVDNGIHIQPGGNRR